MSTHPNVILLLTLMPDDLPMKTMREILKETNTDEDDEVKIGDQDYHHKVLDGDYDDNWQLSGKSGDLLFFSLVTYGYGEQIEWGALQARKVELEQWAKGVCERHHCSFKISVTANYW